MEAQTLTVWDQAGRFSLPSIAFLNKMDKESADVPACLRSIEKKLDIGPILVHAPCGAGKRFHGGLVVFDFIRLFFVIFFPIQRNLSAFQKESCSVYFERISLFITLFQKNLFVYSKRIFLFNPEESFCLIEKNLFVYSRRIFLFDPKESVCLIQKNLCSLTSIQKFEEAWMKFQFNNHCSF